MFQSERVVCLARWGGDDGGDNTHTHTPLGQQISRHAVFSSLSQHPRVSYVC